MDSTAGGGGRKRAAQAPRVATHGGRWKLPAGLTEAELMHGYGGMHPVEVVAVAAVSALAILFSWGIVPGVTP